MIAGLFAAMAVATACATGESPAPAESITLGTQSSFELTTYVDVAQAQHLFASHGIALTERDFPDGLTSINALCSDEVDVAGSSEYPLVGKAFASGPVRVIATLSKGGSFFVVGRRDRGVEQIADLKGKRIGVAFRTINEFYLGRFLSLNGIQMADVTRVNAGLPQLEDALATGSVDAVITREPYLSSLQKRLGANGVSWPAQSNQPAYGIISSRPDWLARHPELVKRFLQALGQAQEYIVSHPAEAKATVQKRYGTDDAQLAALWAGTEFSLSLDQSLVLAMEDEARWTIANDLTTEQSVPNIMDYIDESPLKQVKPDSVNVIR